MNPRALLTAAAAGLICAQALAATPPATPVKPAPKPAATAAGPWSKVPALPTACYQSQDTWREQNDQALAAVQADNDKQRAINDAINQKYNNEMNQNPMALAQAMQQAMMSDPQAAQRIMEQMTQTGQQAQSEIPAQGQKDAQFQADAKALVKQYYAALNTAFGPGDARWTALKKKAGYEPDAPGPGETGVADWIWAEWALVLRDWKAGYETNCATWFSTTGPMHAFMKRYKDYLVNERIPSEKKLVEGPVLEQYRYLNVPTTGWRTRTDYEAVEDYLRMAGNLFTERKLQPECELACR